MERKTSEAHPQPHGLSLPIHDKLSVKEKLRVERNKEYNDFLQNKSQIRRLKRGTPPDTSNVQASEASAPSPTFIHTSHTNMTPIHRQWPQRRDAATLTETVENGKNMSTWDPSHQGRRRAQLHNLKEPYSSEEELMKEKGEEFRQRRRKDRHTPEPECKTRERKINRVPQDITEVESPGIHDHNNNNWIWKSNLQMPDEMTATTRTRPATSKEKAVFATGLLIGTTEDPMASQMRKEMYKQELLNQIAEQQKNKMKEKKLELRVAATGAIDPEKEPDRIMQFGAINRQQDSWRQDVSYKSGIALKARGKDQDQTAKANKLIEHTEQGGPQGRSKVDSSTAVGQLTGKRVPASMTGTPQGLSSLDYFTEDYHRNFSNMLGEMAFPRVASGPPLAPPAITSNYKTPYDAAYYYYGTRNLLDPQLPHYQNGMPRGVQQSENLQSRPQRPPPLRPSDLTETDQHSASSLDAGKVLTDMFKQRTESVLSYQEALREQIRVREESKRREKEEKERYDAKLEADMMAYNPWGRSGGGAPIKDQKGNLFSDLNQMHKINEESYRNPALRDSEAKTPRPQRLSGFSDQSTPQQLYIQERYKEALKQQIEEKKRKQAAEREQMRIEEEKEERRLVEQRAHIQWEYEEEQRKQKKIEHKLEKQSWIHEPKTLRQEEDKRTKQEQEIKKKTPESAGDTEDKKTELSYKREPSPPIPTLQKKLPNITVSRPSSVASQLSTNTEHSVPAPRCQPAALQVGQQEVIRELSALRQCLWKEKSQLEAQLGKKDQQESHYTPPNRRRGRPRAGASEFLQKQSDRTSAGGRYSGAARVNMENIREFNQLKYRDTASREEVLHMYPDPPTDAQSLDIQQQVLLREQRRKIRRMKREEEHDIYVQQLSSYHPGNKPGRFIHRDPMLPSEATFIGWLWHMPLCRWCWCNVPTPAADVYSREASEEQVHQQKPCQPSAERQERTATWRKHDYDEAEISVHWTEPQPDAQPSTSLNGEATVRASNVQHIRRQDSHTSEQNGNSEAASGDEADIVSLCSALERRLSMETVATEPWLRPGTSDAVKRSGSRLRPN